MDRIVKNARRMVQLMGLYARMDALWFLRDTRICVVCIITEFISTFAAVTGLLLLAQRFGGLGGLSRDGVLLMLGFGLCVEGLSFLFFGGANVGAPSRRYGRGQIDHMMMQPVPIWMQVMTEGFLPVTGCTTLIGGVVLTSISVHLLGIAVTPAWLGLFALQTASAFGVVLGFTYLTAVPALYAQVAGEEISSTVNGFFGSLRQFPLGEMPLWLQTIFTTVLPVGLVGWMPSLALTGNSSPLQVVTTPILAVILILLAVFFTMRGWKHYVTIGSQRYSQRGFRS